MKTIAQFALLGLALFCGASVFAGEYNIPSRETFGPSAADLAIAKQIQAKAGCNCPSTGICPCGAGCDCYGGVGTLVQALPSKMKMDTAVRKAEPAIENGDIIVINGVKHYRLGSAAARAVGLADPAPVVQSVPVAQMMPTFPFGGFGGRFGGFSGGACAGGS